MSMRLPQPSDVFEGRYRVDHSLGEGGFSLVYAAWDLHTSTWVALKVLKPDDGSRYRAATSARFVREVTVVRNLRSPHTVRLLDHGETADGLLFVAFEYLAGRDLREILEERGRLNADDVVAVMGQLLESLREAHELGVIHRDLKPENIRVSEAKNGRLVAKLLDFGIARPTVDTAPSITKSNELVGTPRYMSPEQLLSRPLDPSSDIYSLGIVVLELLAGSDALQGGSVADQLQRLVADHVFALPGLEHSGAGLLQIVTRMTARQAADRYQSAGAVLAALRSLDRDPTLGAVREEPNPPPRSPPDSRNIRRIGLGLGAVLAVGAIAFVFALPSGEQPRSDVRRQNLARLIAVPSTPPATGEVGTSTPSTRAAVDAGHGVDVGVAASPGCGIEPPFRGQGSLDGTLLTYVPSGYRIHHPHPIVILLHRNGGSAAELLNVSGFRQVADREHFVVIAPEDGLQLMGAQEGAWKDHGDDARKVQRAMLRTAEEFCIDPKRVFVVGNADGARIAGWASCQGWPRATASNSFRLAHRGFVCPKAPPIAHIEIAPRDSRITPLAGGPPPQGFPGYDHVSVEITEADWRGRNHCSKAKPTVEKFEHGSCRRWRCKTPFVSCIADGGQGWPGESVRGRDQHFGEPAPSEFGSAERVWSFFAGLDDKD